MLDLGRNRRERVIEWARRTMADERTVFADTETTGLGDDAEIVDVAVIDATGRPLLDSLVCPLRTIPPEATAVHGIAERHVHTAPLFDELYPRLADALAGKIVHVWNAAYDFGVLNRLCVAHKLPPFPGPWECAMWWYGRFDGTPGRRAGEFKWWRLDAAAAAFGIAPGGHRALSDAEAARRVVAAMAAAGDGPNTVSVEIEAPPVQAALIG
jgi:DNA polymerase-3 subunit epsilon